MDEDTIPKLFLKNVQQYSDRVALREKELGIWKEVTWNDYYQHVRDFALGLKSLGFEKSDKVSILGDNCREWLYADIAIQAMSGITVGIYPTDVSAQVKYILENSDSKFVLVKDQEQADKVIEVKKDLPLLKKMIIIDMKGLRQYRAHYIISFKDVEKIGREHARREPEVFDLMINSTKIEDVAILVYTSGTTADPKGAMISHKNIISLTNALSR
ncbi:MAG: AMP-binding protein, partial [Thermodesulfobacteriota bacterium]|nr:AMP-binding protein [Thermodesulfobacteriota bacterium]